ncbi:hypothetical protein SLEP1_g47872 [Rubroshorea leprosula]|uniref:Uncharacterized protein n=1 Tax=Rubroshorea leprosula TaxID=152421 RepID=A0AAV5LRX5_9ROSI|nr:hypothetical protein SLEP1_g47872 [Rubroshorea leprosula]
MLRIVFLKIQLLDFKVNLRLLLPFFDSPSIALQTIKTVRLTLLVMMV